jgi:hypothetical protein
VAKLALHQGTYQARSPIANAQVCINLVPEQNPPDAPFPLTMYPAPGLQLFLDCSSISGATGGVRGIYMTSAGGVVWVINNVVMGLYPGPDIVVLGTMAQNQGTPVSIVDNGTTIVFVDGSPNGFMSPVNYGPGSLTQIVDPAFLGANRVDFIDTFMVFNQPGTNIFYTTTSGVVTPFDPTYFAAKEGWNDLLQTVAVLHDNIWLLGDQTTEIWFNAGGATFAFARMPNSVLQQGCVGALALVVTDNALYWISQDRWGRNMCMRGEGYAARRVSTFAVEDEWSQYSTLVDAVGMSYQIGGHEVVGFYFPSGNAWWGYDASTQQWHKRTYSDLSTPWLGYCMAGWGAVPYVGYPNQILVGDRQSPLIYLLGARTYTDNGVPIQRQRSWMHQQQDGQRIAYTRFALSMTGAAMSPDTVNLDWSDDAGQTFGTPVPQTINNQTNGQYLWRRLGYGRDRVYRATWSGVGEFALNGAYSDGIPAAT